MAAKRTKKALVAAETSETPHYDKLKAQLQTFAMLIAGGKHSQTQAWIDSGHDVSRDVAKVVASRCWLTNTHLREAVREIHRLNGTGPDWVRHQYRIIIENYREETPNKLVALRDLSKTLGMVNDGGGNRTAVQVNVHGGGWTGSCGEALERFTPGRADDLPDAGGAK